MGWILYGQGLYPSALTQLERTSAREGNPRWEYHLAMAYAKVGDNQRGLATLRIALKQNPNMPEAKIAEEMLKVSK